MTQPMLEQDRIRQCLSISALFRGMDDRALQPILDAAQRLAIDQGQYVFRQGESASGFYMVIGGEAELTVDLENGESLIVGRIGSGGHFGETSLLTHSRHATSARALTDLILAYYEKEVFHSLLLSNTAIGQQLCCFLAHRLRVSFHDYAVSLVSLRKSPKGFDHNLDPTFFAPMASEPDGRKVTTSEYRLRLPESTLLRQIVNAVRSFGDNLEPVLLTGETGTGRRMIAHEIHRAGTCKAGPYVEIDIRDIDPMKLEGELFGYEHDGLAFTKIDQLGIFERLQGGTVVLYNAEHLEPDFQRQFAAILRKKTFTKIGGEAGMALRSRIILICTDTHRRRDGRNRLLPCLSSLVAKQHFQVAPLRMHRRDIPRLVHYYLKRYNRHYGRNITQVDDRTLGMFMNYDWPGNLTEMASVIQRAVILGRNNEPLTDRMLLGVPRSEGKWEFNLLRLHHVHRFITSRYFPALPRIFTAGVLASRSPALPLRRCLSLFLLIEQTAKVPNRVPLDVYCARTRYAGPSAAQQLKTQRRLAIHLATSRSCLLCQFPLQNVKDLTTLSRPLGGIYPSPNPSPCSPYLINRHMCLKSQQYYIQ